MEDLNSEISKNKTKKTIKFNELYHQAFEFGQSKKLIIYNCDLANIIEKIYIYLEYVRNSKTFIIRLIKKWLNDNLNIMLPILITIFVTFNYFYS